MKYLGLLFSICLFACSAKPSQPVVADSAVTYELKPDSMIVITVDTTACADMYRKKNDSLTTALFQSQFKVNKVRYYLNICLKNPSQDKFLKGWVRRAIQ